MSVDVVMFCESGRYGVVVAGQLVAGDLSGDQAGYVAREAGSLSAAARRLAHEAELCSSPGRARYLRGMSADLLARTREAHDVAPVADADDPAFHRELRP